MGGKNQIVVAIVCGGPSAEREVSLVSARNVFKALDKKRYQVHCLGLSKSLDWFLIPSEILNSSKTLEQIEQQFSNVELSKGPKGKARIRETNGSMVLSEVDIIFPVMHGPFGEDGSLQGFLNLLGVPYVGTRVLGAAVGMDKVYTKKLLERESIAVSPYTVFRKGDAGQFSYKTVSEKLGKVMFVKPANMGSSVGVTKVIDSQSFQRGLELAFRYDQKVLVEKFIEGREIECAVLGNLDPKASTLGEIVPSHDFYSYDAKYIDDKGAKLQIPADIPEGISKKMQDTAIEVFKALDCRGLARVDFFLEGLKFYVNEVNVLPGFTSISMYPKLWEFEGVTQSQLVSELIELGFAESKSWETVYRSSR